MYRLKRTMLAQFSEELGLENEDYSGAKTRKKGAGEIPSKFGY